MSKEPKLFYDLKDVERFENVAGTIGFILGLIASMVFFGFLYFIRH